MAPRVAKVEERLLPCELVVGKFPEATKHAPFFDDHKVAVLLKFSEDWQHALQRQIEKKGWKEGYLFTVLDKDGQDTALAIAWEYGRPLVRGQADRRNFPLRVKCSGFWLRHSDAWETSMQDAIKHMAWTEDHAIEVTNKSGSVVGLFWQSGTPELQENPNPAVFPLSFKFKGCFRKVDSSLAMSCLGRKFRLSVAWHHDAVVQGASIGAFVQRVDSIEGTIPVRIAELRVVNHANTQQENICHKHVHENAFCDMAAGTRRGWAPCLDEPRSLLQLQDALDPSKHWLRNGELHLRCNLLVRIQDAACDPCFAALAYSIRLQDDYGQLLRDGGFAPDTSIIVESAGVDQCIKAHACVLWARSDFFKRALQWKQKQGQQFSITLGGGLVAHAVKAAVSFIYTGSVLPEAVMSLEDALQLVHVSSFLVLTELTSHCEDIVAGKLSEDNVAAVLAESERLDLPVLRAACTCFISSHMHKFEQPALQDLVAAAAEYVTAARHEATSLSVTNSEADLLPASPGDKQGQQAIIEGLLARACQPPGSKARNFRRNKYFVRKARQPLGNQAQEFRRRTYFVKEAPVQREVSRRLLHTHALDFLVRDQAEVTMDGDIVHCVRSVCDSIVLPNSLQPGQAVFFVGDPKLGPKYRQRGKVVGIGYALDALSILFEGGAGISCINHAALASEDPGLPGDFLVDQEVYFVGTPQKLSGGDILFYRKRGVIVGDADYVRVGTHVRVIFDCFRDSNAHTQVQCTWLSATDPGLPGNFTVDQVVQYLNPGRAEPLKQAVLGVPVQRGPDWKWGNQDGGKGSRGTTLGTDSKGWVGVRWQNGYRNRYRVSVDEAFDLQICDDNHPPARSWQADGPDYSWFAKDSFLDGLEGTVVGPADWKNSKTHIKVKFAYHANAVDVRCEEVGEEKQILHQSFQTNDSVLFVGPQRRHDSFEWVFPAAVLRGKRKGDVVKSPNFKLGGLEQNFRFEFYPKGWTQADDGNCSFYMWSDQYFRPAGNYMLSVNQTMQLITDSINMNHNRGVTDFCVAPDGDVRLKVELTPTLRFAHPGRVIGASGINGRLGVLFDGCQYPVQIPSSLLMKNSVLRANLAASTPSISSRFFEAFGSSVLAAHGQKAEKRRIRRGRRAVVIRRLQLKESRRVSKFPRKGQNRKR